MKNTHWLVWSLIVMALATSASGQPAATVVPAGRALKTPADDFLVLSNVTGEVRVLDSQGLVLEKNLVFLPRIKLSDLSPAELQSVLETRAAYNTLTAFGSLQGTNAQGAVIEKQLQQVWRQGQSLAEKIQTRLEILADLREYNINVAFLPGSVAAAGQYAVNADAVNDRLTNRAAIVATAAAQVEASEQQRAAGLAGADQAEHQAREIYRETAARSERANDRAMIANGQAVGASQQVAAYMARCAALSTRLAGHGINVPSAPPFYPIPPLTIKAEVDAERTAN
jgi:hypothetical protein